MEQLNIVVVGVGGQGTLLASRILGGAALKRSYDVKVSEVHGMSQRGGSVVTYVRVGDRIYSPLVEKGEADIVLAFEQLEALRWLEYLKKGGKLIVNKQKIDPMPVITGKAGYPSNIVDKVKNAGIDVVSIDALDIAMKCGNIKVVNMVLIGKLARFISIDSETWIETIKETVPERMLDMNLKAFKAGYSD